MNGEHWGYIALAYGVTAVIVLALVLRNLLDYRRLSAELARLERKGAEDRGEAS
ncbi:MAG: heme exporter protein CcmD [Methylocystaceae bacterium]|nr:MAG: heme exporter protein CcmD [Methylocystaceae bacterium]